MTSFRLRAHPQTLWYVLWSAMFLISAGNALAPRPIFSGTVGLIFSVLLAAMAGIQMLKGVRFLRQKEAALSVVLLIIFCSGQLIQFSRTTLAHPEPGGTDFSAYYIAAKLVSEIPGQSLYQLPLFADGRMNLLGSVPMHSPWQVAAVRYHVPVWAPYIYPPFCAVLMKPVAHLPFAFALFVWKIATVFLVAGALLISLSLGGVRIHGKLAVMLGVGLFSYYPLLYSLILGQIGGLILFLIAAGVWLLSRNRVWASALCFALATLIKLTPVLAVPILIIHRRWKWLIAYAAWMISLLIFSVWQAGWAAHLQFLREVLPSISLGAPAHTNSSIVAYVQELFLRYVPGPLSPPHTLPPYAAEISRSVASVLYYVMLVRVYLRRRDGDLVRDLVIMALLGIVVSPVSWIHHYTIALLPLVYLWCKMPDKGSRTLLALFLAVATDLIGVVQFSVTNHMVQLILAGILPGLMIAVAYLALAPRQEALTGRIVLEAESLEIAYTPS